MNRGRKVGTTAAVCGIRRRQPPRRGFEAVADPAGLGSVVSGAASDRSRAGCREEVYGVHPANEGVPLASLWRIVPALAFWGPADSRGWMSAAPSTHSQPISRTRWITARPGHRAEATPMPCPPRPPTGEENVHGVPDTTCKATRRRTLRQNGEAASDALLHSARGQPPICRMNRKSSTLHQ